jgi:hypothetical protein
MNIGQPEVTGGITVTEIYPDGTTREVKKNPWY